MFIFSGVFRQVFSRYFRLFQKGRKGAGVKGAGVANCRIFRSAVPSVVNRGLFSLFPCVWGEEKKL